MRKFFSLLKLQINAQYGFSNALYNIKHDKKAFWKGVGIGIAILLALGEVIGIYTFLMYQLYSGAAMINAPQMILTMAAICSGLIVLIFGIFYIIGTLFLARDTEFLASLPLSQGSVFMTKFAMVLLGEYPFAFFLMLPPVIIYGIGTQKGVIYYILAIICTLLLPFLPLVISAFLALLLMNIVSRSKRRDMITIIGSIIMMVLFIGGQNYLMSRMPENREDFLMALLQSSDAIIEFMGRAFPPSIWITKVLSSGGVDSAWNLLFLVAATIAAFLAVYLLASFIYQRGATAQLETRPAPGKTKLTYRRSSQVFTIFKNELLIILRTPIYALNSLVVVFMAPLLLAIPFFGGNFSNDSDLQFIFQFLGNNDSQAILMLVSAGIITLLVMINPAVSTTFSREGKNIWVLKTIPVKPVVQVYGKLLAGYSISFVATLVTIVIAIFLFKINVLTAIMILILCSLALVPVSSIGLYIDLIRPKLQWNNPQEAIKQNMNAMLAMLIGFLAVSVFGIAGFLVTILITNIYAMFGIMVLILSAVSYICLLVLDKTANKAYWKIEG
ncbi:MAG: putative ABC transporter permease subunit [Acetivibrionales bacterium]